LACEAMSDLLLLASVADMLYAPQARRGVQLRPPWHRCAIQCWSSSAASSKCYVTGCSTTAKGNQFCIPAANARGPKHSSCAGQQHHAGMSSRVWWRSCCQCAVRAPLVNLCIKRCRCDTGWVTRLCVEVTKSPPAIMQHAC
jgi:hypothetical protein